MKARWVLVAVMLAIGVGYVIDAVAFRSGVKPEIAVVRTFGDLRAQPPIQLATGGTVRVGLEASRADVDVGVLAYFLFEVPVLDDETLLRRTGVEPVPSLALRVGDQAESTVVWNPLFRGAGALVVMVSVVPHRLGPTPVEVTWLEVAAPAPEGDEPVGIVQFHETPLKTVVIEAVASGGPWFALDNPGESEISDDGRTLVASLFHTGTRIGVPHHGICNVEVSRAPLPRMIPPEPDADVRLRATDDGFAIAHRGRDPGLSPDNLLARFEIVDDPVDVGPPRFGPDEGAVEAEIELDWGLDVIGADPGDRVALELLWCPGGWRSPDMPFAVGGPFPPTAPVLRSNRVVVTMRGAR